MPYIKIKAYPKDEKIKQSVIDKINQLFLDEWGCPQSAISISYETVEPDDWQVNVAENDIKNDLDKMYILDGQKKY